MTTPDALADWRPRPRPERIPLTGRYCRLEPLDPARHGDELLAASTATGAEERFRYLAETPPDETFVKGVHLIQDQLLRVLRENRVEKIESIGAPFDPNFHEAVSQIETDEVESQHVARVIKEGYRFHDTVLRPAMVVVAR